jgi:hypothetical protein
MVMSGKSFDSASDSLIFLRCFLRCFNTVVSSWRLAGGGPAAAHFSCLAKKSKPKKATAKSLPFGFPKKCSGRREACKLAALKHARFFIRLPLHFFGSAKADEGQQQTQPPQPLGMTISPGMPIFFMAHSIDEMGQGSTHGAYCICKKKSVTPNRRDRHVV